MLLAGGYTSTMSASIGKRIAKWTVLTAPWLLALLLGAGWGLSEWTPDYLGKLLPSLARDMGIPLEEFHIRDAGLFSAEIGPVRLGSAKDGLVIDNVQVTYTPASLKMKRVNSITLNGVTLTCSYDGETFSLPLMNMLPTSGDSSDKSIPTLPFDSLAITDAVLHSTIQGKQLAIPFAVEITPSEHLSFSTTLTPRDQEITVTGKLGPTIDDLSLEVTADQLKLGAFNDMLPTAISGAVDLNLTTQVNLSKTDQAEAEIKAAINQLTLPGYGVAFDTNTPIEFNGTLAQKALDFTVSPIQITAPSPATITLPKAHLSASTLAADFILEAAGVALPGELKAERKDDLWDVTLTSANPDKLAVKTGGRQIGLGGLKLAITGTARPGMADLIVTGKTQSVSLGTLPLQTGPISFTLPLAWPAPKRHTPGKLHISDLRYDKYKLGTIASQLRQEYMQLALGGTLYSQLLPDLQVKLAGQASVESRDASFTFDIPKYLLTTAFDPATLVPAAQGVQVSGNLAVEGGLDIQDGVIESRLGAFLTGGTLSVTPEPGEEKAGTRIEGIRLYFESPDLLNFRSAPAQLFSFEKLTAGPIQMGKGLVTFQLEPNNVVLVERLGFDWVGGHVASRAFRIVPGHEEYDVTLFCSRLRLSSLLKQLGLAEAEGEAALSGELPVSWKRGKISFNNGFLHSTPGQGGTIQVEAMQDLVSAIPKGTPERGQLELAQEAIKDFEYKWVRIKADTVGEDLLVRLSLDGKPASTLPFVYTKEFGGFARVTGDMKGSNFQGLRLDVNFSLPLDRILLYKDIINMIE